MSDIASLWNELEELLATIAPTVLPTLNPPATDCDLDLLESKTGLILPQDFRQSLKIHNGQSDPSRLELLTEHGILLSCEEIAEAWRMLCEILALSNGSLADEAAERGKAATEQAFSELALAFCLVHAKPVSGMLLEVLVIEEMLAAADALARGRELHRNPTLEFVTGLYHVEQLDAVFDYLH